MGVATPKLPNTDSENAEKVAKNSGKGVIKPDAGAI
jgi:hypothetical protein